MLRIEIKKKNCKQILQILSISNIITYTHQHTDTNACRNRQIACRDKKNDSPTVCFFFVEHDVMFLFEKKET